MIITQNQYSILNQNLSKNNVANSSLFSRDSYNFNSDEITSNLKHITSIIIFDEALMKMNEQKLDGNDKNIDAASYADCCSSILLKIDKEDHLLDELHKDDKMVSNVNECVPNSTISRHPDSASTHSGIQKKFIVKIVTVFAVLFFILCFAMIAFTLRMSDKIDAQIRESHSRQNQFSINSSKLIIQKIKPN